MPVPSRQIRDILGPGGGGSDGWEVFYRARALKAAGDPVVELTIGEHDIGTDPAILGAMDRSARGGAVGYAAVPGIAPLRAAIADRVAARTGVTTGPGNVLVTPGGQAALFAALTATCDPGDTALIVDPYYATYPGTVRAAGAQPVAVPADPAAGFQPDAEALAAAAARARALLVNTPNNPTGAVYGPATLAAIAAICTEYDLWLISDEVYDAQVWDGAHQSPRALPGMADRTLVIGSMSKSHAMTGSRLGWVIGPEALVSRMIDLATHTTYGVPGFIQEAALHALTLGDEFEATIAAPFRRRRDRVLTRIAAQDLARAVPASGGMYVMLDLRATGLSGTEFAEALLDAERIAVMPGESFGCAASGHVRIALTRPDAELDDAIARLLQFVATLPDRRRQAARESA